MKKLILYSKSEDIFFHPDSKNSFRNAALFDISNVLDSMSGRYDFMEFPSIMSPYKDMWLEGKIHMDGYFSPLGFLLSRRRVDKPDTEALWASKIAILHQPDEAIWRVSALVHLYEENKTATICDTAITFFLDENGMLIPGTNGDIIFYMGLFDNESKKNRDPTGFKDILDVKAIREVEFPDGQIMFTQFTSRLAFALALMNVKNVEIVDSHDFSSKEKSKRQNRHKGIRHYTLRIRPGSQRSVRFGDMQPSGVKSSFHFARGHFKTYTEDAPLFGQHVGTWWWEAHTKGSKSAGTIMKDYEVHPPKKDEE